MSIVSMTIVNMPAFLKGVFDANKKSLQFMRTEMKRGAQRIRKTFIREQLKGRPGIAAGKLAKGKNIWTFVKGDTHKDLAGHIGISRLLHVHEKGATIVARNPRGLLFLRRSKRGKGQGEIFAAVPVVRIPARLKFRQLVAREAPKELVKVAEAGSRGVQVALTTALKKSI